jgi:hypothetical protein
MENKKLQKGVVLSTEYFNIFKKVKFSKWVRDKIDEDVRNGKLIIETETEKREETNGNDFTQ